MCVCSRSLTRERKCIMAACWPHLGNRQSLFPCTACPTLWMHDSAHTSTHTLLLTLMLALMPTNDAGTQILVRCTQWRVGFKYTTSHKHTTEWLGVLKNITQAYCTQQPVQNEQLWIVVVQLWWTFKVRCFCWYGGSSLWILSLKAKDIFPSVLWTDTLY